MTKTKHSFIHGQAGQLEAVFTSPADEALPAVVLCHPHPLHGGTMHTKLIYWLDKLFQTKGLATLKFNFRGVDLSEGQWDEGVGETDDVISALDWLKEHAPHSSEIWIAGFSFGCYAGLKAMQKKPEVSHFFAVAPAVNLYDFSFLSTETRPVSVIHGTKDDIVPYETVERWNKTIPCASLTTIPEAGHFFVQQKEALEVSMLQSIPPI